MLAAGTCEIAAAGSVAVGATVLGRGDTGAVGVGLGVEADVDAVAAPDSEGDGDCDVLMVGGEDWLGTTEPLGDGDAVMVGVGVAPLGDGDATIWRPIVKSTAPIFRARAAVRQPLVEDRSRVAAVPPELRPSCRRSE